MPGVSLAKPDPTGEHFWRLLTCAVRSDSAQSTGETAGHTKSGQAEGRLLGGNSLAGLAARHAYSPDYRGVAGARRGRIYAPYRRMFAQLRNAGILRHVAGLLLASSRSADRECRPTLDHRQVRLTSTWTPGPVIRQYGHIPRNHRFRWDCAPGSTLHGRSWKCSKRRWFELVESKGASEMFLTYLFEVSGARTALSAR